MLYFVQVVMWGVAEKPRLFTDAAEAQAAFVESTVKQWGQRYTAFCEHHGMDTSSFAAAQAFVKAIDVSEKSTINFWPFSPEEAGIAGSLEAGAGNDEIGRAAQGIAAVKDGLARLLEDVSKLADGLNPAEAATVEAAPVEQPVASAVETESDPAPASACPQIRQESDPEKYKSKEWSIFVSNMRGLFSGSKNECYLLPRGAWRDDVYSDLTSLEYWDWVADRMEHYKEVASAAGYQVTGDPDAPGHLRFANAQGEQSEECYDSEWETWCAAGLHAETSQGS